MSGYAFDFNRAKTLGSPSEVVDYLRHTAKTNANWDAIDKIISQNQTTPNFDKDSATLDYLSNLKGFEVQMSGFDTQDAKEQIQSLQAEAKPQGFAQNAKEFGARVVSVLDTILPTSAVANPLFFDNDKDYQTRKDKSLQAAKIAQDFGLSAHDLDSQTHAILSREEGLGLSDVFNPFLSDAQRAEQILSNNRARDAMLSKDFEQLSEEEKQIFRSDEGVLNRAWDSLFKDDEEAFEDYKEKLKAKRVISQTLQDKITALNMISEGKSIRDIFLGDESTKQKYLDDVAELSSAVGFDSAGFDERGDLYLVKNDQKFKVNEGFFDNFFTSLNAIKGEVAGGIAGSVQGFKSGKTPQGKVLGAIAGGAVGSMLGASADVLAVNAYLDRDNTARELIGHSLEAGLMSVAGDGVVLGVQKFGGKALKGTIQKSAKILDDTAIGGLIRNIPSQNLRGAQKILSQSYTDAEKQSLKEFAQEFGGALEVESQNLIQQLKASLSARQMPFKDSAFKVLDALDKPTLKARQLELIEQIRADKSGGSLSFLLEVANQSPQVSKNLKGILNQTTLNLEKSLSALGLDEVSMQAVFKTLQQETKKAYNEAMDLTLAKLYDESYKTTLDPAPYREFVESLKAQGLLQDAKPFLNFIQSNVFNPQGVTFTQLENARKLLNSYAKKTDDPNLKDHIQRSIERNLRQSIQGGIDNILSQNKQLYQEARNLYENALSDYAVMKETLSLANVKKAMDAKTDQTQATNAILKFIKGQGSEGLSNFNKLKAGLDTQGVEDLELGILGNVFKQSLVQEDGLRVLDSKAFKAQLEGISGQFQSKKAQEALNLLEGFHKLFLNDGALAWELKAPSTYKEGSGLATSVGGAIKQKSTKIAFLSLLRLLPDVGIPLTPIKFNTFNEATQGASLRFHIHQALKQSVNVQDFKTNLAKRANKSHFNSATRSALKNFVSKLETIYNDTLSDLSAQNQKLGQKETRGIDFTTNKGFQISKENAIKELDTLQREPIPQSITKEEFLQTGLKEVINKDNFLKHLENKPDSFNRLKYLNLVEPTMQRANIELTQGNKKGYIKAFETDNKNLFYVLVSDNGDKLLITGIPTTKKREVIRQIKKADSITRRDPFGEVSYPPEPLKDKSPTPSRDYTTQVQHLQSQEPSNAMQPRTNTLPSFKPDEIIDVEFIAREPDIKKRIEYKRHNARAKNLQKHQTNTLEDLSAQNQKLEKETKRNIAELKGDNFNSTMPKEVDLPLNVKGEVEEWVKEIAGIQNKEISADLKLLAQKHPEMFKKPSDAYRLFVKIKNNPTHFLPNNREDVAMIAKIINDKKIGKMGVKKENGEVVHLTKREIRTKDVKVENPLAVEPPTHYHTSLKEQGDGANAHLLKDNQHSNTKAPTTQDLSAQNQKLEKDFVLQGESKNIPQKTEIPINPQIQNHLNLQTPKLKADLEKLKNTHSELFKTQGAVARLIHKIQENPTFFFKNNRLDMQIVGSYIKNNFGELGIVTQGKNIGEVGHILEVSNAPKRIHTLTRRETKNPLAESVKLSTLSKWTDGRNGANALSKGDNIIPQSNRYVERISPKAQMTSEQESSNALQPRTNTLPSFKPDEIIDVEFIAREPDIKKRIEYKRHNARAKNLQKHQTNTLEDLSAQNQKLEKETKRNIADFGQNYPQFYHKGSEAVNHLLQTQSGQVQGAFYKEGLGDITLAWGNDKFGLNHILKRRTEDFMKRGLSEKEARQKALEFAQEIPQIIKKGRVRNGQSRAFIDYEDKSSVIALDYKGENNKWIITAYHKEDAPISAYSHQNKHNTNTSSETRASGDPDIIPKPSNAMQPRTNTLPSFKPDEIIDVEFIAREPDIKKRIEYKRHNARAKNLQKHQTNTLEDLSAHQKLGQENLPIKEFKSNIKNPLSLEEIKTKIAHWDLNNPKPQDRLLLAKVEGEELKKLKNEFDFKGNYEIAREIDAQHIKHALDRHSNEMIESSRNQIPIKLDEILDYQSIIKTHDIREVSGNKIIYKKQINGHYVVVEEALTGKNKLEFITMWKSKGNLTTPPTPSLKNGYDLDRTLSGDYELNNSTTNATLAQPLQEQLKHIDAQAIKEVVNGDSMEFFLQKYKNIESKLEDLKAKQTQESTQELLNKHKPLRMAKEDELSEDLLLRAQKINAKIWLNNVENTAIKQILGNPKEPTKITMTGNTIKHILKRHGADSLMVKNGQEPITLSDIKNHAKIVNQADKIIESINKDKQRVLISGKQVNGHYVVVESISTKQNELKLKTMYKQNGKLEDNAIFRNAVQDHLDGAESLSAKPSNHLDSAFSVSDAIIPQNKKEFYDSITHDSKLNHSSSSDTDAHYPLSRSHSQERGGVELDKGARESQTFTYHTKEPQGIVTLRKELKDALSPYLNKEIINKQTGLKGVITESERNKISSKKAVDKSLANGFSRDEHFKVSEDLKNLFENASLKESHKDYKENPNILQVHRFQTGLKINDKNAIAKITLFEKIEGKNKIYTLELEDLKPTSLSQSHTSAEVAVKAQVTRDVVRPNANIAKTDVAIIPQAKAKTIQAVEHYAQSAEFKALSAEKQQAILSLKEINPAPMPEKITTQDLENLTKHFNSKTDKEQRGKYAKLFEITQKEPDLILAVRKNGEERQEYIKAFQHKESKDLYYLAITKDDKQITGIPTTKIKKVMNDIVGSERILNAESLQGILNPANLANKTQSPAVSTDIIPQTKDFKAFDFSNAKTSEVKTQLKDYLKAQNVLNHTLENREGIQATFSLNSLSKMTSDNAIKKSVDNGFSRNEHLNAVANIKEIFKNAKLKETQPHKSGDLNVKIHRMQGDFNEAGVLLTLKESLDKNQKRLYSLELQLIPSLKSADTPLNKSTSKGSFNSLQETKGGQGLNPAESSIVKTDKEIIPQSKDFKAFDFSNAKTSKVKTQLKDYLKAQNVLNHTLENREGIQATFSLNSLSKMTSDNAIKKSVDNGFSRNEHLNAVANIKEIFGNSKFKEKYADKKGNANLQIIRLDSKLENGNALITIKESMQHGKRVYSIELEMIPDSIKQSTPINTELKSGDSLSLQETKGGGKTPESPIEKTDAAIIPQAKAKTIQAVEHYAQSAEFKALSAEKQQAILSLKEINPAPMPEKITTQDLENLTKHFNSKQDKSEREYYLKLFDDTKESPHILLETLGKNGEIRKEYIKAYEHTQNKDLYYIAITQENDSINITAFPTTQARKVINDIQKSERVLSGGSLGDTTNRQADKVQSPKLATAIIPQRTLKGGDILFKDDLGKAHRLTKETQELWLNTFNLKSLDEDFIPQFSKEVQEALGGKEIKLTQGSLLKLSAKNRTQYIPQIKETLENPDFILRDTDNILILAKEIDDKQYFTSINLETKDYFISISNAPKKLNILKNKVKNGAEVIYQSPNAKSIFYTETLLQPNKSLGNKIDTAIIPQRTLKGGDILFKDDLGKAHRLTKETQELWLKTFELKSLDEDFIPQFSKEVQEALGGKEIKLTQGSLLKLSAKNRTQYIPQIKATLEKPDKIISHQGNVIFAKEIDSKKYFTSVGKDFDTHITIVSNAPKKTNTLENKLFDDGEVIYQSSKFENLRYNQTFTEQRLMPNKIDTAIIPQRELKNGDILFKDDLGKPIG